MLRRAGTKTRTFLETSSPHVDECVITGRSAYSQPTKGSRSDCLVYKLQLFNASLPPRTIVRRGNACRSYRCLKGFAFFNVFRKQEDYPEPILDALKRYKSYNRYKSCNGVWIFAIVTL